MPRRFSDYSLKDWLLLRPATSAYGFARYRLTERRALSKPFASPALEAMGPRIRARRLLVTVAFNDADLIGWQAALIARHVPDVVHVVADNSRDPAKATAVAGACEAAAVTYIRVPGDPWSKLRDGGKSHGYALNWIWRNLVLPGQPSVVGFLDHDIFPVVQTDPFRMLEQAAVAGKVRIATGGRWYLWPGFCFYQLDRVRDFKLDFGPDWADGFDTGGINWRRLYRHMKEADVHVASSRYFPISTDLPMREARYERIDDWHHESNYTTSIDLSEARRREMLSRKRQHTIGVVEEVLKGECVG